jgi:squalene monooxygenase
VVIVGGGILGASMATVLARGGRKVTLIERDMSEPDRIVGELLQPGGYEALVKLGLKDALVGTDCHTVRGYVIHDCDSNASVKLSYPLSKDGLIQTGRSFHHGRFVMGLRRLALNEPNVTVIEGTAQALFEGNNGAVIGVQYKDKNTGKIKTVKANFTVVADGCFSKFRKDLVSSSVVVNSNFVGIIMHDVPQCESGHAEIVLGDGGPILVYQISSTCTRILVDVPNKLPSNLKEYLIEYTSPQLPEYIRGPFLKAIEEDRLRSMPNSFLPPVPHSKKGVVILGDAFNMRHPLTGAGMSTALNDVLLLSKLLLDIPYLDQQLVTIHRVHYVMPHLQYIS